MAEQEHYSLRWNNHQNHILRAFDALLQTKSLVDVTLVCAETSIRAHKVVLSACSPFFQSVFSENPCKHPVIVLKDFHGWVVQAIVDFMYRGEISVPQERLQILIQAGESLEVRGLVDHPASDNVHTPAESLDDFMETLASPNSHHSMNYDDAPALAPQSSATSSSNCASKPSPLVRPHMFIDGERPAHHPLENRENCISPLPRRKQARPRRRSGECGPHDLTSRPASPLPSMSAAPTNFCALDRLEHSNAESDRVPNDSMKHRNPIIPATMCGLVVKEQQPNTLNADDEDEEEDDGDRMDLETDNDENHEAENENDDNDSEPEDSEQLNDNDSGDGPENLCIKNSINNNSETISNNNNNSNKNSNSNDDSTTPTSSNNHNNQRIGLSLKDIRHLNRPPMQCRQNPFSPSGPHIDGRGGSPGPHKSQSQANQHLTSPMSNLAFTPSPGLRKMAGDKDIENITGSNSSNKDMNKQQQQPPFPQVWLHGNPAGFMPHSAEDLKREREAFEARLENESPYMDQIDLSIAAAAAAAAAAHHHHSAGGGMHHSNARLHEMENNLHKEFTPSSPMSLPSHFNPREGPQHPPSPLQFPGMSSALTLTPPHHMFGLDSPLGLFPPGMDPGKLYNPLMEMPDPRAMHPHHHGPFLKKKSKLSRPKGQHSAPRGGPPRSWTNAELTEALHHVWNKKMTTSQASRLFGIPYNSLLMYVRGKYGKSLNLEQLRKGCISGPPIELLTMGLAAGHNSSGGGNSKGHSNRGNKELKEMEDIHGGPDAGRASASSGSLKRSASSEPDLLSNPSAMFNPFPPGFYSDFTAGFPGLPLSMLNLLPPEHRPPPAMHNMSIDEDCKSDRSKQSLEDDYSLPQPLALNREDRRELVQQNGQD